MKKRILSFALAAVLALGLTPAAAFATDGTGGDDTDVPTASGANFFANGTPITISAEAPERAESVTLDGFTAEGDSAYVSWSQDGATKYVGVSDEVWVYGGGDGSSNAVTVASTDITMTGGSIESLFGGNLGSRSKGAETCSSVTGDVRMSVSGAKSDVSWLLHGAGANNTCVEGTVYMDFDGVDLSDETDKLYVNGGVNGTGAEGTRDIENGKMDTSAVADNVVITAKDSEFYLLGAGGSGSTKVGTGTVELTNCSVANLYFSGINGEIEQSNLTMRECDIAAFAGTNRGFVGNAIVNAYDTTIGELYTGATPGCFASDSGKEDGAGITGSAQFNFDSACTITEATITPLIKSDQGQYETTVGNLTITKGGDPLKLDVEPFMPKQDTSLDEITVSESSTVALNNVVTSVASGQTLTNAGTIQMDKTSKITVPADATFGNAGKVVGEVEGTQVSYVARVGSTGYKTLQEAINAAESGAKVMLLANTQENVTVASDDNITLDLNGFTLDGGRLRKPLR